MIDQLQFANEIQNYASSIFDTVREPLLILGPTLRVRSANRAFYRMFQVTPAETEGRQIYELGNGQWDIPALRNLLSVIVPLNSAFDDFEVEHEFEHIGHKTMLLNARRFPPEGEYKLLVLAMEDVTERRRAEAAMKDIAFYARNIVDTVREPLLVLDTLLNVRFANNAFYKTFRLSGEATENCPVYELDSGHFNIPRLRELLEDVLPHSSSFSDFEVVHDFERTGARTLLLNAQRLDSLQLILLAFEDITERKRIEEAMLNSQAELSRLALIAQCTDNAVILTDVEGKIEWVNAGFTRVCGHVLEEVVGRTPGSILQGPETDPATVAHMHERLIHGQGFDVEIINYAKSGHKYWAAIKVQPIHDEAGHLTRFMAIESDVTARKQTEALLKESNQQLELRVAERTTELREANEFLQALLESIQDGIVACDAEGMLSIYNRTTRELGVRSENTDSRLQAQLIAPEHWLENYEVFHADGRTRMTTEELPLSRALRGEQIQNVEFVLVPNGGAPSILLAKGRAFFDGQGNKLGAVVSMNDITERKRAEAALLKAHDELERRVEARTVELELAKHAAEVAGQAKSEFLTHMSHEIRTPMNAILGFSQLMLRDRDLTPRQSQFLGTINRSGEHLLALINDILEMSKIEAGRTTLNNSTIDLPELLKDLEMMFRVRTDEKGLQFAVQLSGEVPRYIVTDINKLRQIFINVLGNAVKFTDRGSIEVRVTTVRHAAAEPLLRIEVEDTGPGISADDQEKLFRHFEQTRSGQQAGVGTGLGLAISREFVRLMGGDITVASQVGRGSVFAIELPLNQSAIQTPRALDQPRQVLRLRPGQALRRVLIADDVEDNRDLLAQILGSVGFEIQLVSDGQQAVQKFEQSRPDLLLIDLRMPVMDGREAIRRIRAAPGGTELKIIAVTASTMDETRPDWKEIGANDFLRKPFLEAELFQKIHDQLGVEFLYADAPAAADGADRADVPPHAMEKLPAQLVRELQDAVVGADLDLLLEKIQLVAALDPHLAKRLRGHAELYQYQTILDLLQSASSP